MKNALLNLLLSGLILMVSLAACGGGGGGASPVAALSSDKAITAFSFTSPAATGTIDENAKTISVTVPNGTNVTALVAAFTTSSASVMVGSTVQVSGTTPNNFTGPVAYTVAAADGTAAAYTVTVTVASGSAKAITDFSFTNPASTGTIDESAKTISVTVPNGTNVTALVATFTTSGASVIVGSTVQVSGTTPNNFTGPVAYTVAAADGTATAYTVTVTVTAAPAATTKAWRTEAAIETGQGDAFYPQIAFDGNGNAMAVWSQEDGGQFNIYANKYTKGAGWGTARLIDLAGGRADKPQIAMDASGNAIAVWMQHDGAYNSIYANRYTAGAGWETAVLIENNTEDATSPQIAFDGSGNAIAVWIQTFLVGYQGGGSAYANYYTAGAGWGTATLIGPNSEYGYYATLQIAFDAGGNAIAVWPGHNDGDGSIYANKYTAGAGWGTAAVISSNDTTTSNTHNPCICFDPNGNAMAVWSQWDGTWSIYANRYAAGTGWGTAVLISSIASEARNSDVVLDASGNAIAVWSQDDTSIYANRFTPGIGWGTAELIENREGRTDKAQIAIDPSGNAIAVWSQEEGTNGNSSVNTNRYTAGLGWGTAERIGTETANAYDLQIAIDTSGNALVVWEYYEDAEGSPVNIYASEYR